MALIAAALILLILAFVLISWANRRQKASGLPGGRVIYADTGSWRKQEQPFYDSNLGLTGKPDYVVDYRGALIPIEVKSSFAPPVPHPGHVMQLMSYCLLLDRTTGQRPPFGILHYRNRTLALDFSQERESELLETLVEMRRQEKRDSVARSHEEPARCAACGYRQICEQNLD